MMEIKRFEARVMIEGKLFWCQLHDQNTIAAWKRIKSDTSHVLTIDAIYPPKHGSVECFVVNLEGRTEQIYIREVPKEMKEPEHSGWPPRFSVPDKPKKLRKLNLQDEQLPLI